MAASSNKMLVSKQLFLELTTLCLDCFQLGYRAEASYLIFDKGRHVIW